MFNQLKTYIYSRLLVFMERRMRFNKILFAGFAVQFLTLFICAEANYKRCEICVGSGSVLCIRCGGKGRVRREGKDGNVKSKLCLNCSGNGRTLCSSCIGKGWKYTEEKEPENTRRTCATCNGRGTIQCSQCINGGWGLGKTMCSSCLGAGYRFTNILTGEKETCRICSGTGKKECGRCGGSGRIDCRSCNGMGYFGE